MNTLSKLFWAFLAGLVLLWVGGGTPVEAHNQKFTPTCETLVIKLDSYQVKKGASYSNVADLTLDGVHYNSYPFNKSTTITVDWPVADFHSWTLTVDAYNTSDPKHEGPFVGSFAGDCLKLIPVVPEVIPPTCDSVGTPIPNEGIIWVEEMPNYWVAYFNEGFFFEQGVQNIFDLSLLTEDDGCVPPTTVPPTTVPPTTVPPVTVPPTTVPPVTIPPVTTPPGDIVVCIDTFENDDISGCFPVATTVPEVATGLPPVPPAVELPATGSNTTRYLVTIAAIVLLCGLGLAYAARRNDNIKLPWRND